MTAPTAPAASSGPAGRSWHINPADIPLVLGRLFPSERLRELAHETGLVRRERKVDPVALFWSLILTFGVSLQRTLADIKTRYEEWTVTRLTYSSWYDRFTPTLAKFLKTCVQLAVEQMASEAHRTLADRLHRFEDVLIQDSTVIRLHAALAKKWPATRSRTIAAGVKVAMLVSAVANGPKRVALFGERTSEVKTLRIGPWVKNRVLLIDLGFFKFQIFARIAENGGFFVSRLKESADPFLQGSLTVHRGRAIDLKGKRWKEVRERLHREVLDAEVEVLVNRRMYARKRSREPMRFRLVAVWNPEARQYHVYVTNIPVEVLAAEDVAALYRVRWEVELVFKELKGRYALDQVRTTKAYIVESLIWTAILTMLASRRLYSLLLVSVAPELRARYTPLRWANSFIVCGGDLLRALLGHLGLGPSWEEGFAIAGRLWEHQALDPHVHRRRLKDGWWA